MGNWSGFCCAGCKKSTCCYSCSTDSATACPSTLYLSYSLSLEQQITGSFFGYCRNCKFTSTIQATNVPIILNTDCRQYNCAADSEIGTYHVPSTGTISTESIGENGCTCPNGDPCVPTGLAWDLASARVICVPTSAGGCTERTTSIDIRIGAGNLGVTDVCTPTTSADCLGVGSSSPKDSSYSCCYPVDCCTTNTVLGSLPISFLFRSTVTGSDTNICFNANTYTLFSTGGPSITAASGSASLTA